MSGRGKVDTVVARVGRRYSCTDKYTCSEFKLNVVVFSGVADVAQDASAERSAAACNQGVRC